MQNAARKTPVRWPFWLLIVAWICANTPQFAAYTVVTWLAEARHFSHQRHLMAGVASVLAGEKASAEVAASPVAPAKPLPIVPADAVLKKIELAFEDASMSSSLAPIKISGRPQDARPPEPRFEAPLHEPPRSAVQV